ncbi:hypothetical protein E2C01_041631 [Portunus trituberculatus]|uniref:Uncharacterized protein n=1 Tax=Portunus trituberculatus TaxID=210409 RepID=A0A5B7FKG5_PORTR|nr:hypothetical protein [Portunus trituberculatus]
MKQKQRHTRTGTVTTRPRTRGDTRTGDHKSRFRHVTHHGPHSLSLLLTRRPHLASPLIAVEGPVTEY